MAARGRGLVFLPTTPLEINELQYAEDGVGYAFKDRNLLALALTHQSYVNEHPDAPPGSNERLEFLGDSIVGMVVAERIFNGAPELPEGDLTVRRSQVIRKETLAAAARSIGLGNWLVMGTGESTTGGNLRESNLADAFEAVTGAVYLDGGYDKASSFVSKWLGQHINEALESATRKDPKSLLQEYLQANGKQPPRYELSSQSGTPHDPVFTINVLIDNKLIATGKGSRKVDAERKAASEALEMFISLGNANYF